MARWDTNRWDRSVPVRLRLRAVLVVVAYVAAAASILSYAFLEGGRGAPSKVQLLLLVVTLGIVWLLSFRSAWG